MSNYLSKFQLAPVLNEEEVEHFLMPVEGVIDSYIVESAGETRNTPQLLLVSQLLPPDTQQFLPPAPGNEPVSIAFLLGQCLHPSI